MATTKIKTIFTLLILALTLSSSKVIAQGNYDSRSDDQYNDYSASYQDFYDGLAPYGQWINDPMYGYVWLPDVGSDFRPYYSNGYWAMTQYGNTWVSNYDWGWAPFHYGRWTFDNYYGWLWIPDTQWAPAWVSWRSNNDYYGWAPLGPGVSINVSLNSIPVDWWVFLSPTYFYEPGFHRYCNNDWRFNRGVYRQTNYINYTYNDRRSVYYTGPRADDYRQRTGRQASMFNISNNRRRGTTVVRGNRINIYRPTMSNGGNTAPRKIVQTDRRVSQRPQTFIGNNIQPEGRQKVLRQTPVENTGNNRMNTNPANRTRQTEIRNEHLPEANPVRQNGENREVREQQIQKQRESNIQMEQNRSRQMQQQRDNEQQRIQQENNRQRLLQQRDNQMIQQRNDEQNRQRSIQTEEDSRRRMQQMRDAQIQQQREQESNRQRMQQQNDQQPNRPAREAPPARQMERTQPDQARPTMREQRSNQPPAPNNNPQTERFRGR
jgi:hypothetical protein